MHISRKRLLGATALATCLVANPTLAQDVVVPRGLAQGGAAVAGGLAIAKGGQFCMRHPGLCAVGVIGGLAVGGTVLAMKKRQMQKQGLCGPTGETC